MRKYQKFNNQGTGPRSNQAGDQKAAALFPLGRSNMLTGFVASIPVGLDTIGSVVLDESCDIGSTVKRSYTRLGNFYYGGSLNILLFSKELVSAAMQTRMGNQINVFNVGTAPSVEED